MFCSFQQRRLSRQQTWGTMATPFSPGQLRFERPHRGPPGTSPAQRGRAAELEPAGARHLPSGCGSREKPAATQQVHQSQRNNRPKPPKSPFLSQPPRGASPQQQAADWLARDRAGQSTASLKLRARPRRIETRGRVGERVVPERGGYGLRWRAGSFGKRGGRGRSCAWRQWLPPSP